MIKDIIILIIGILIGQLTWISVKAKALIAKVKAKV